MGVSGPVKRVWDEPAPLPLFVPTPVKTDPEPVPIKIDPPPIPDRELIPA